MYHSTIKKSREVSFEHVVQSYKNTIIITT